MSPLLPILNPSLKQESLHETFGSNWFGKNVIGLCLKKIIQYRDGIFYAAIAFSVAAVVAAFFTQMILVIVLLGCSAGCFSLAVWAFRTRESKIADALGQENARLGKAVVAADNTLIEEKKNVELLKEKNKELDALTQDQAVEIKKLGELTSEHEEQLQDLKAVNEDLQLQNAKLLKMESWFKSHFPQYFEK